jgi:glycosyltransferase involved in cell wall biosynthesis
VTRLLTISDVTVIIPVYNCEKYVSKAIDSCLKENGKHQPQVIVVDDGSTDNTPQVLANYAGLITVIQEKHGGQANAINRALSATSTRLVAYLDADDENFEDRLATQVSIFNEGLEVGLVHADRWLIDENGRFMCTIESASFTRFDLLQRNPIARSTVMHRRSLLDVVGMFDCTISGNDDWDMWVRMNEVTSFVHVPKPLVKYRVHANNISLTRKHRLHHNRRCRFKMLTNASKRLPEDKSNKMLLIRAQFEMKVLKGALFEHFPGFWARTDRILCAIEKVIAIALRFNFEPNRKNN